MQTLAANLLREGYPLDIEAINFPAGHDRNIRILTNLPSYPWNHQTRHWVEPWVNIGLRERSQAPHDLLGLLVPGTNPQSLTWRHTLRATETPWVRDHVIQSNMLYPGCGFVSLVIEAITQLLVMSDTQGLQTAENITGYELRDVNVLQALVVPDTADGIEIQTVLRPVSEKAIGAHGWKQFGIYSVTANNHWIQHAQGLVTVDFQSPSERSKKSDFDDGKFTALDPRSDYSRRIDSKDMWNVLDSLGIQYGPTFRNISGIIQSGKGLLSVSTITVPDASASNDLSQSPVIHPCTLDAAAPLLTIQGLVFSSLGRSVPDHKHLWEKELCSKVVWDTDPDLSLNYANPAQPLSQPPTGLLSLIVHKNPRARILEIGASIGSITHSWLLALGAVDTGGPLAALYHFTNSSGQDFDEARKQFAPWAEILAFDTLDVEHEMSSQGFELSTYDAAVPSSTRAVVFWQRHGERTQPTQG
jgi:acyl transferase domain-containing protein